VTERLILARHAATEHAAQQVITGTIDAPISDLGREQARRLVAERGPLVADLVVSSPLARALETARIITGRATDEIETWDDARERDYGRLQGMPPEEVASLRPTITYIQAGGIEHSLDPPGGETLFALRRRARRLARALQARPERTILVVSHQTLLQQLTGALLRLRLREALAIDITILQVDEVDLGATPPTRRAVYPGASGFTSW
jgi:broad specificity phosphatase PhoE